MINLVRFLQPEAVFLSRNAQAMRSAQGNFFVFGHQATEELSEHQFTYIALADNETSTSVTACQEKLTSIFHGAVCKSSSGEKLCGADQGTSLPTCDEVLGDKLTAADVSLTRAQNNLVPV